MKRLLLASAALLGLISQGHALTLPSTYAPAADISSTGYFESGVTATNSTERSPFFGTIYDGRPYDVVHGNFSDSNPLGLAATFSAGLFGGSNASAGTFTFVDGSPDPYNVLVFNLVGGGTNIFEGSQITTPTDGTGVKLVTLTGIGAYTSVSFGSISTNAFEFAALTTVPLPASLPMFGGALLALAGFGYGLNRWVAPKGTKAPQTA